MSGAASVNLKEIDLSTRVASFEGVYGGIVLPARKGQLGRPSLVTNDTALLNRYTPNAKVDVGDDLSFFSALSYLERANKLWVKRVVNQAYYGGLMLKSEDSSESNEAWSGLDLEDPTAITITAEDALVIHAANPGAWANDIGIKITTIEDDPDLFEENSFLIEVFKRGNENVALESHLCSRVLGQKDGRGLNMYVEDVLEASAYIRAISNDAVDEDVLPKTQSTVLYMDDGDDGLAITDANMVNAAQDFKNKAQLNVTLLLDGGYSIPAYQQALDSIAQTRMDCVAILSTPYASEVNADYITALTDYRKTELNLNSSYSALYTPHLQIQDRFNDRKIWAAPDGYVAGSISFSAQNYEIWYPPAGFKRGILNVLDTRQRFDDGELDELANAGINPIRFIPGEGIVVWGQKTLQARASALDRLNVRLLLIVIEPAIKKFLENYLFELNDANVRSVIETKLESYLETIKARKGVTAFDVVCDESNNSTEDIDANRLNVDVFLRPTRSIEEIPVRIVIVPGSLSFSDAAGAI